MRPQLAFDSRRWMIALLAAVALHAALFVALPTAVSESAQWSQGAGHGAGEEQARAVELHFVSPPSAVTPSPVAASVSAAVQPSADATPGPSVDMGGGGRDAYYARLRVHLQRYRQVLATTKAHGTVVVRFHVDGAGWVSALALEHSAGDALLDAEALELLRRAAPLPAPPQHRALSLAVPIVFE